MGIVGIASLSFASFHAKDPLQLYVRDYNIVSLWSHSSNIMISEKENLGENISVERFEGGSEEMLSIYRGRGVREKGIVCF